MKILSSKYQPAEQKLVLLPFTAAVSQEGAGGQVEPFCQEAQSEQVQAQDKAHQQDLAHQQEQEALAFPPKEGLGLCLGFFDGLHLGHQELLSQLIYRCSRKGLRSAVFSFDHLPKLGAQQPRTLFRAEQRASFLKQRGLEYLLIQEFSADFAALSPRAFVEDLLLRQLNCRLLVVGFDFRFGAGMCAGVEELRSLCEELGLELLVVPAVKALGEEVHSKRIRGLLEEGEIEQVNLLLGQPYTRVGKVFQGRQLGRKLGFPTANLELEPELILPKPGVYRSTTRCSRGLFPSLSFIGSRPTVEADAKAVAETISRSLTSPSSTSLSSSPSEQGEKRAGKAASPYWLETVLYGFEGELYGEEIEVSLLEFLRPQQKFASLEALQEQVQQDLLRGQSWHKSTERLWPICKQGNLQVKLLPTTRFRTGVFHFYFYFPMEAEAAAERNVLFQYLLQQGEAYPTHLSLNRALAKLYGADLSFHAKKEGDLQCIVVSGRALRRGPDGSHPFQDLLQLCFSLLLCPLQSDGQWSQEALAQARQDCLDELDMLQDQKDHKMWEEIAQLLYPDSVYKLPNFGSRQAMEKIDSGVLTRRYRELFCQAAVSLELACEDELLREAGFLRQLEAWSQKGAELKARSEWSEGDATADTKAPKIADFEPLQLLPGRSPSPPPLPQSLDQRLNKQVDWEQSQIVLAYALDLPYSSRRAREFQLFRDWLSSLLFKNVREEKSLCYDIRCRWHPCQELLFIHAGVHKGSEEACLAAIQEVVASLKNGQASEDVLRACFDSYRQEMRAVEDSPEELLRLAQRTEVTGLTARPVDRLLLLTDLQWENIRAFAAQLERPMTYIAEAGKLKTAEDLLETADKETAEEVSHGLCT